MTLSVCRSVAELSAALMAARAGGQSIGLVPTMGNLHAGHLSLVAAARGRCDTVVASIFVNPTQFGPNEDFQRYPRTPEQDLAQLEAHGVDAVFMPDVDEMYPLGERDAIRLEVPGLSEVLCGAHRPGHFAGVASVVLRLFLDVRPDVAVFGRKDLQQLAVIRRLVEDFRLPIDVVGMPTCRESDGLAMSSRNQYLSESERAQAPVLHAVLSQMLAAAQQGDPWGDVCTVGRQCLQDAGFKVDYVALRPESDLVSDEPQRIGAPDDLVALAAARLGSTRLIDNVALSEGV
ncbi:MAG: pantoate--beta-alanine ligase [Xanthomonadales bacterium]|nr:pantoate--beta-alanine ligase [Xanthomonadales bacterium]